MAKTTATKGRRGRPKSFESYLKDKGIVVKTAYVSATTGVTVTDAEIRELKRQYAFDCASPAQLNAFIKSISGKKPKGKK